MARKILILNGPNLNLLGTREPGIYGVATLGDIEASCRKQGAGMDMQIDFRQSNHEGELVDWIQQAGQKRQGQQGAQSTQGAYDAIVINPAAYSHTSIAIRDALGAVDLPLIEVHISNIFQRESFRHHSHISAIASGVICGLGAFGYNLALDALNDILSPKKP
ncbi:3-dehydroquinate dehydratase II [hydrothermal vent metagenome]|uniref:3-dehydroquinate dehydratase n=1 Tax=hydrothermal vent metagenome TaxID=652676 RepID=A0A3B0TGB9_9ZZZZ